MGELVIDDYQGKKKRLLKLVAVFELSFSIQNKEIFLCLWHVSALKKSIIQEFLLCITWKKNGWCLTSINKYKIKSHIAIYYKSSTKNHNLPNVFLANSGSSCLAWKHILLSSWKTVWRVTWKCHIAKLYIYHAKAIFVSGPHAITVTLPGLTFAWWTKKSSSWFFNGLPLWWRKTLVAKSICAMDKICNTEFCSILHKETSVTIINGVKCDEILEKQNF